MLVAELISMDVKYHWLLTVHSIGHLSLRASSLALFPDFCFALAIFLSALVSYLNFFFLGFFGHFFFPVSSFSAGTASASTVSSLESSSATLFSPSFDTSTDSTVTVVYLSSLMYSSS